MKASQRDALRDALIAYKRFDLTKAIARAYPDQPDMSAFMIGAFSAENLVIYSDQLVSNFEEVISKGLWVSIPGQAMDGPRRIDFVALTQQFISAIEQSALDQVSSLLAQLIGYQMDHGFWRLPEVTSTAPDVSGLKQTSDRIKAQAKRLEEAQGHLEQLLSRIESERAGLNSFSNEKKAEFEVMRKMVDEAKQNLKTIIDTLQEARQKEAAIGKIEESGKKVVEDLNVELGVIKKELDAFKVAANDLQGKLTTDSTEANRTMELAKQIYEFVKGKEGEIIRLTGMAADGSVGTKFNARSMEIGGVLKWWRIAVPVSIAVAIAWAIAVFYCFPYEDFTSEWANLGVNLLKTAPAFVLMGFVMAQYSKERNLREDYAFKAAVSMTINAYADILQDGDKPENVSRQKLIIAALKQVHNPPKLHSEKGGSLFSWRAKDLQDSLKNINETLKEAKDTLKP